jgi:hypothetical protein
VGPCNPSTCEAKEGGSWNPNQPELHSETLSQKKSRAGDIVQW